MHRIDQTRDVLRVVVGRLRDVIDGLVMPTPGGCVCDPVAWERDTRARMREREDAAGETARPHPASAPLRQL